MQIATQMPPSTAEGQAAAAASRDARLRGVARDLEAAFISEMLKHAGFAEGRSGIGSGGAGEAQFASLLRAEHARLFAERGGIGLAESIFRALAAREAAAGPQPQGSGR
jgi:Rod binding domain-containing protein